MRVSGGIPVDRDGRTRGVFTHNPSTFRLSMVAPNLMQIPRGSSDVEKWVKEMFVAPPGYQFWARDFSGIEAVLVGWFAGAREYVRLAKIDVHSFYTAYGLHELDPAGFNANDLPHLEWEDSRLRVRLGEIKKEFKRDRNEVFKHLVHGGNFLQTPAGAQKLIFKETEVQHEVRKIARLMGAYKELFPEIPNWHWDICKRVDGTKHEDEDQDLRQMGVCYVRNPYGHVHHFYNVLDWTKAGNTWFPTFGEDAKRLVAFLPQSTAAAIIKQSARELWYEQPVVGNTLRLLIHDEIFGETQESDLDLCLSTSQRVMERPRLELPLDPAWGMGEHLNILTEPKQGASWGAMH
jgi:hypothetical protein